MSTVPQSVGQRPEDHAHTAAYALARDYCLRSLGNARNAGPDDQRRSKRKGLLQAASADPLNLDSDREAISVDFGGVYPSSLNPPNRFAERT